MPKMSNAKKCDICGKAMRVQKTSERPFTNIPILCDSARFLVERRHGCESCGLLMFSQEYVTLVRQRRPRTVRSIG